MEIFCQFLAFSKSIFVFVRHRFLVIFKTESIWIHILYNLIVYFNLDIITDAQFGFRKNISTKDAIFIIQSSIQRTKMKVRKFYCCFIDYKKAFDFINRSNLWFKLIQQGIEGKVLRIIRSLYEKVMFHWDFYFRI